MLPRIDGVYIYRDAERVGVIFKFFIHRYPSGSMAVAALEGPYGRVFRHRVQVGVRWSVLKLISWAEHRQ